MTASIVTTGVVIPDMARLAYGTYSGAGSGAETLTTGFSTILACGVDNTDSAKNTTISVSGGTITFTVASGSSSSGVWWAIGKP